MDKINTIKQSESITLNREGNISYKKSGDNLNRICAIFQKYNTHHWIKGNTKYLDSNINNVHALEKYI